MKLVGLLVLSVLVLPVVFADVNLTQGLVHAYTFDSDSTDQVGVIDGVLSGDAVLTNSSGGYFGEAIDLDGTGDYVRFPNVNVTTGEYTISVWAKSAVNQTIGDYNLIYRWEDNFNAEAGLLEVSGFTPVNDIVVGVDQPTGTPQSLFVNIDLGTTWHHYAVTYREGALFSIYVDGVQLGNRSVVNMPGAGSVDHLDSNADFWFGARHDGQETYEGLMDELLIYNREFNATEVLSLYAQNFSFPFVETSTLLNGIESYWSFDKDFNDSVNTRHGTPLSNTNINPTGGVINNSVDFNTNGDGIEITADFHEYDTNSLSAWFNSTNYPAGYLFYSTNTGANNVITLGANSPNSKIGIYDGTAWREWTGYPSGGLHHFVFNFYTGTLVELFVDGVTYGNITYDGTSEWTGLGGTSYLGTHPGATSKGRADEIGIWNRSLTVTEIADLYNNGSGFAYPFPLEVAEPVITASTPLNNTHLNGNTTTFNVTVTPGDAEIWELYINGTLNQSTIATINSSILFYADLSEGLWAWEVKGNTYPLVTTGLQNLVMDFTLPIFNFTSATLNLTTLNYSIDRINDMTSEVMSFTDEWNDRYIFAYEHFLYNSTGTLISAWNDTNINWSLGTTVIANATVDFSSLPDGVYTLNVTGADDHTAQEWSPDLVETANTTVTVTCNNTNCSIVPVNFSPGGGANYDYGVTSDKFDVYWKDKHSDTSTKPVFIVDGLYGISMAPKDLITVQPHKNGNAGNIGNRQQSNAVIDYDTVTYPDNFGQINSPDAFASLKYVYTPTHVQELFVISDETYVRSRLVTVMNPAEWNVSNIEFSTIIRAYFDDDLDENTLGINFGNDRTSFKEYGLSANDEINTNEDINFLDSNNNTVFYVPAQYAYDDVGATILLNKTLSMTNFGNLRIDVQVPVLWMNSTDRVYPVYVDPSVTVGSSGGAPEFLRMWDNDTWVQVNETQGNLASIDYDCSFVDRCSFSFTPSSSRDKWNFELTSNKKLYHRDNFVAPTFVAMPMWVDFVTNSTNVNTMSVSYVDDYTFTISITMLSNNTDRIDFESIGGLNVVNEAFDFEVFELQPPSIDSFTPKSIDGLQSYYQFENNLLDSFGVFDNGSVTVGLEVYNSTTPIIGSYALELDGFTRVNTSYTNDFLLTDDITINVWFRTTDSNGDTIFSVLDNTVNQGWLLNVIGTNTVYMAFGDDNTIYTDTFITLGSPVTDGVWHMVTWVRNSVTDEVLLYVDGVLGDNETDGSTAGISLNDADFVIGQDDWFGSANFVGSVDELSFFKGKAYSTVEIVELYNSGTGSRLINNIAILSDVDQIFTLTVSDPNDDVLTYEWYVNGSQQFNNNPSFTPLSSTLVAGVFNITGTVTDGLFNVSQEWTLTINLAPPIIADVSITPALLSPNINAVGQCTATAVTSSVIYDYLWYQNGTNIGSGTSTNLSQGTQFTTTLVDTLILGSNYTFDCFVTDKNNLTANFTNSSMKQVLANSPPTVSGIIPIPVYNVNSTLEAYCTPVDLNGENTNITWELYREASLFSTGTITGVTSGAQKLVYNSSSSLVGFEDWYVSCNATDGFDNSGYNNSPTISISDLQVAPQIVSITLNPEFLLDDYSNLTSTAIVTDANPSNINLTFTLYNNGGSVESTTVEVANSATTNVTWTYNAFNNLDVLYVSLLATDNTSKTDNLNSSNKTVRNTNAVPTTINVRTVPSSFAGDNDTMNGYCTGVDSDGDNVQYNYEWYVNNGLVKSGTKGGYTNTGTEVLVDSLSPSASDVDDTVIFGCKVNDIINLSAEVNATAQVIYAIGNQPPSLSIDLIPIGVQPTSVTFNVSIFGEDNNNDMIRFEWKLVKNDAFQNTSTTQYYNSSTTNIVGTLESLITEAGDKWYVLGRAFDSTVYSLWVASNTVTISNLIPNVTFVNVTGTHLENVDLTSTCIATDGDNQSLTYSYEWFNGTTSISTSSTISSALTTTGESWKVGCRAYDGIDFSPWVNSSSITVINSVTAPVLTTTTITGLNDFGGFSGTCLATDAEGDDVTYDYTYYKNGVSDITGSSSLIAQGASTTINVTPTITSSDEWFFECQATDIDGVSNAINSTTLIVPTFTFTYHVESIDTTEIRVNWETNGNTTRVYKDGILETDTVLKTRLIENLLPSTQYEITLIPVINGFTRIPTKFNVTTQTSDNNAPVMISTTIVPTTIYTNSSVAGACKASDIDSNKVFYNYEWQVDNNISGSGVTGLYDPGISVSVGSLSNTLFSSANNISLYCAVSDGVLTDNKTSSKIVQNLVPMLDVVLVKVNNTVYGCTYDYSDGDNDAVINVSHQWFKNNALVTNTSTYPISSTLINDVLQCEISVDNAFHTVTVNSSSFLVGDFNPPSLIVNEYSTSVFTDSASLFSATCSDTESSIAEDYPRLRFINPNNALEEVILFPVGDNLYTRYNLFDIEGIYTSVEVLCIDGNSNLATQTISDTITSVNRATATNVGGTGGGGSGAGDDGVIVDYDLKPQKEILRLRPGSTILKEFEILNKGTVDLHFTASILRTKDFDTFDWITFNNGGKTAAFDIKLIGGLSSDNKFVRYQVSIPEDTPEGVYTGIINIDSLGLTKQLEVEIAVDEGAVTTIFDFLTMPLFSIPGTGTPTGNVVAGEKELTGVAIVTVGWLIVSMIIFSSLIAGTVTLRRRIGRRGS